MKSRALSLVLTVAMLLALLPAGLVTFAATNESKPGRILYDCGFGLTLTDENTYLVGDEVCLKDALRGQLQNDGSCDVTFYGWDISGVTYQPGDRIPMTETGLVATAVWVRAVCIDAAASGENADGSRENPFKDPDDAYLYLIRAAETENYPYEAISLYLLSNVDWVADDFVASNVFDEDDTLLLQGSSTGTNYYHIRMRGAAVPVLFTAKSDDTVLKFIDPQETKVVSYFTLHGETVFDAITLQMDTKQITRFLPTYDLTLGMRFSVAGVTEAKMNGSAGSYAIFLDFTSQSISRFYARIYGGIYPNMYYAVSSASRSSEILVGTAGSTVIVNLVSGANSSIKSTDALHLYNCKITGKLVLGGLDSYGNTACSNKLTVTLYADTTVANVYDYGTANTAGNAAYLTNTSRSLIFNGFSGDVKWYHLALTNNPTANGLDGITLINGAQVKFTGASPAIRSGGTLFVGVGSAISAEGLAPVGVFVVQEGEAMVEKTYAYTTLEYGVEYSFETDSWLAHYVSSEISALGCSIRVKEPYGLRFGYEMDSAAVEEMTGKSVVRRGVLIVPEVILGEQPLVRGAENIIDLNAPLPITPDKPNQFTGCLVDSLESPDPDWLDVWAQVVFVSRGYLLLDDGEALYTDIIRNSIQNVFDVLDSTIEIPDNDDWSEFVGAEVQNETGMTDITSRAFYPDAYTFLSDLETLRKAIGNDVTDKAVMKSELGRLLANSTKLGLYSDYYLQTYATAAGTYFGAKEDADPIGGGVGYVSGISGAATFTATDDNTLKSALDSAVAGDIILVKGDITIDLADFILAGDDVGFDATQSGYGKIDYQFTVPAGVTLMGSRGTDGQKGAILKTTSYVENMFYMEEGSRMSGLVLMGPDKATDDSIGGENLSGAIKVIGDNVTIDNCEIAGFYRTLIEAREVSGLTLNNNYFHHCLGHADGIAIDLYNTDAEISDNLFTNLRRILSLGGAETDVQFTNNVESSNDETTLILLRIAGGLDNEYPALRKSISSLTVEHNTFFSKANPFWFGGLVQSTFVCANNWLAYPESVYLDDQLLPGGSAFALSTDRVTMENNLFGISSPVVASKNAANDEAPADNRLGAYSAIVNISVTMPTATVNPEADFKYKNKLQAPVLSASYYSDNSDAPYTTLENLITDCASSTNDQIVSGIESIMQGIGCYSNFLAWKDSGNISMEESGEVYGAYEYNDEPLGGGVGYSDIFTTGDYIVTNESELRAALQVATAGEVIFIPGHVQMELGNAKEGTCDTLRMPRGVTLASDRGYVYPDGRISTGALLTTSVFSSKPMITVAANDVRITGLTIQGPDPGQHLAHHKRAFTTHSRETHGHPYYYQIVMVTGVSVTADYFRFDNCEISAFNSRAIALNNKSGGGAIVGIEVHNNYIHHNQVNGLGYGVAFTYAYGEIYGNYFNYNRHSIAGSGQPTSGYKAFCNVEFGASLSTYFDMHGGYDRNKNYEDETAGEYVEIYNNTFLGTQAPYNLRGFPTSHRTFEYNVCYNAFDGYGKTSGGHSSLTHYGYRDIFVANLHIGKNIWNVKATPTLMDHGYGDNYESMPDGWLDLVA